MQDITKILLGVQCHNFGAHGFNVKSVKTDRSTETLVEKLLGGSSESKGDFEEFKL